MKALTARWLPVLNHTTSEPRNECILRMLATLHLPSSEGYDDVGGGMQAVVICWFVQRMPACAVQGAWKSCAHEWKVIPLHSHHMKAVQFGTSAHEHEP